MDDNIKVIEIKVGDKVIRNDGVVGKIVDLKFMDYVFTAEYDNGEQGLVYPKTYDNFYLIGKTVLGNKIDEKVLQKQLDIQKAKVEVEQNRYDQLRKQMWYLKNRMVDDWQEKKSQTQKEKQDKAERNAEKPPKQAQKGEKDNRLTKG